MKKLFCTLLMVLALLACTVLAEETLIPLPHDPNGMPVVFYQGNTVVGSNNAVGIRGEYLDQTWTATLTDGEKTAEVELLQQNRQSFKFIIPADFKANTTYTLTLAGEKPLTIVLNAPKVQWMQGDEGPMATVGGWVRVQGECMTLTEDTQHTLTLTAADGTVTTLNAEKVYDAYSVQFAIPELPLGDYTAVYSNGFAQDDASVLTIGVSPEAAWTKVYDVTKYKIDPTGGKDATAMVNVLLGHVSNTGGGVLYFPKGTYRFSAQLNIPERVIIRGDGYEYTQFWWDRMYEEKNHKYEDGIVDTYPLKAEFLLYARNNNVAVEGITFSAGHCAGLLTAGSNTRVENCRFIQNSYLGANSGYNANYWRAIDANIKSNAYSLFNFASATNVKVVNCQFTSTLGQGFVLHGIGMSYLLVQGCTFKYTGGVGANCTVDGLEHGIFEDCTVERSGSAFKGNNIYYARVSLSDTMTGHDREIFTTDVGGTLKYQGGIEKGADELTYVFPEGTPNVEAHVKDSVARQWPTKMIILSGTGAGQWRNVVSASGNTVTIESPFDV